MSENATPLLAPRRWRPARWMLVGTAVLLATGGIVAAQNATFDPQQLPAFTGKVAQYDLTPRGDIDGLIFADGTEAHFPPHLGSQVAAIVRPGDQATVRGLKARALALIEALSIENEATHQRVVDAGGPPPPPPAGAAVLALEAGGKIKMQLHGPRGELNGVLLEDGTMVHLPPPEASRLQDQLAPGRSIYVRGSGVANVLGKSIEAAAIGPSASQLAQVEAPPPPPPGGPLPPPEGPPPPRL